MEREPKFNELSASDVQKFIDSEVQKLLTMVQGTPAPKPIFDIFNQAIGANTNFVVSSVVIQGGGLTPALKASQTPCLFRIYVVLSVAGVFSVQRTRGGTLVVEYMNGGVALAANSAYIFDILVDSSDLIDFQTTVAATILKFSVVEKDDVT